MATGKIFLSHAAKDKALADALVDLIQTAGGVSSSKVFCTSLEGLDVPSGRDFITYIKDQIQTPEVVILLLTPNYFASHFCMAELGAAWALSHHALPLLVPPLTYSDVKGVLSTTQIDKINDSSDMDRFFESLLGFMRQKPLIARLRVKKEQFLERLPEIIKGLKNPSVISPADFKKIKEENDDYAKSVRQCEEEIESLKELVSKLELLKDAGEVAAIKFEHLDEMTALLERIESLKNALSALPDIAVYIMYRELDGHPVRLSVDEDREAVGDVTRAIHDDFLTEDDGLRVNANDPKVKKALKALWSLKAYIHDKSTEELEEAFEEEYGYSLSVDNFRLWKEHLNTRLTRYS